MQKKWLADFPDRESQKKLGKIMKLIILFFFGFMMTVSANSYAQKTKLDINLSNTTVLGLFKYIEQNSEFVFLYRTEDFNTAKKVNIEIKEATINQILDQALKGENVTYDVYERQVIIRKSNYPPNLPQPQKKEITGTVKDNKGATVPGSSVIVKGTTIGVITDMDGNFRLQVPSGTKTLSISFIGMQTIEVDITSKSSINAVMEEETIGIEEVVAIGYGTVKKSDLTGSVSSIKSAELKSIPTLRLDQALKGKISGLLSTATSSAPGAGTSIRIRGSNSISANNEPLYVVDGFVGGINLNDINVDDIESLEVLKDASATAIYGSRGSNGVILITTRRGMEGKAKISFESYVSFQSPSRLIPVLNGSEFASFMNEVKGSQIFPNPASYGEGTNWQKEIYRENVPMTSNTLSIVGGDKKNKYFISGNYFNQEGISINSNLERYHFSLNSDHQLTDKLKIGTSVILSRRNYKPGSFGTPIIQVAGWQPTLPVKDANGNYSTQIMLSESPPDNPVAKAVLPIDNTTTSKILGLIYGEYEIFKGLSYKLNLGSNFETEKRQQYSPSTLYLQKAYQGTATINNSETLDLVVENTLNYTKK